jgi:hypothetical protein
MTKAVIMAASCARCFGLEPATNCEKRHQHDVILYE